MPRTQFHISGYGKIFTDQWEKPLSSTTIQPATGCQLNEEALERPLQSEAALPRGDGADLFELGPGSLAPCLLAS